MAQVCYHLAIVASHLAVVNTQAGKVSRQLWESYRSGRNFYGGCSRLIEDIAVALSRERLSKKSVHRLIGQGEISTRKIATLIVYNRETSLSFKLGVPFVRLYTYPFISETFVV